VVDYLSTIIKIPHKVSVNVQAEIFITFRVTQGFAQELLRTGFKTKLGFFESLFVDLTKKSCTDHSE